ncbi:sigma-54-dependent Fis family transcriptional regulator [Acidovorax sp. A1169]|uniref:sigma-54 interaction domain-containing protein n=1 Tax=Acidovorax sp. A1169 TaxID=3059524 RepID=UPI00273796C5|nr:sigma 54-interacting transcriptional regulator [Acidovorax sp. A1169]MDP4078195.1 sigma 54-interacting transcriptional regulator [Acidovorax sp. A1169]
MPTKRPPAPVPAATSPDDLLERQGQLIEELKTLVNHVPYGLMVLEPGGVVRHLNAEAARQLRLPRHLAQGRTLGSLLDFDTMVEQVFLTGEGYTDRERVISTPRFQLHVLDTAVPVKAADGRVLSVVNTFREISGVHRLADRLAGSQARHTFDSMVGQSPALRATIAAARKAAAGQANVLLCGESGTGKEVLAQAIHNASARREGPFIAVNCAALPRDLIESELFGHAPGAFTGAQREGRPGKFEAASGGTIFLDEVSELPLDVQAKLLRVLQEREVVRLGSTRAVRVDARVITASNRDLHAMVARKEFREDLYYRCHVIAVTLPPLRERLADVALLATHFLARYGAALGKPVHELPPAVLAALLQHPWPGNVRELENAMERLVNLSEGGTLDAAVLGLVPASHGAQPPADSSAPSTEVRSLRAAEREAIVHALKAHRFNVTRTAQALGIAKPTLYAKLRLHGIALERPLS